MRWECSKEIGAVEEERWSSSNNGVALNMEPICICVDHVLPDEMETFWFGCSILQKGHVIFFFLEKISKLKKLYYIKNYFLFKCENKT